MIFKKVNIMNELDVLEQSQRILDDRLEQKQIDHSIKIDNDEKSCCSRSKE